MVRPSDNNQVYERGQSTPCQGNAHRIEARDALRHPSATQTDDKNGHSLKHVRPALQVRGRGAR